MRVHVFAGASGSGAIAREVDVLVYATVLYGQSRVALRREISRVGGALSAKYFRVYTLCCAGGGWFSSGGGGSRLEAGAGLFLRGIRESYCFRVTDVLCGSFRWSVGFLVCASRCSRIRGNGDGLIIYMKIKSSFERTTLYKHYFDDARYWKLCIVKDDRTKKLVWSNLTETCFQHCASSTNCHRMVGSSLFTYLHAINCKHHFRRRWRQCPSGYRIFIIHYITASHIKLNFYVQSKRVVTSNIRSLFKN